MPSTGSATRCSTPSPTAPCWRSPNSPLRSPGGSPLVSLRASVVPRRAPSRATAGLLQRVGSVGGWLTLAALPLVGVALVWWRRELRRARTQLGVLHLRQVELAGATARAGGGLGGAAALAAAPVAGPGDSSAPATRRRGSPVALVVVGGLLAAGAAAAALWASRGPDQAAAGIPRRDRPARSAPSLPTRPVAVLNATSVGGAATRVADQLRRERVTIAGVGNLTEQRPPGLWILYAPGAQVQAQELSRLLRARSPRVAPIDPVAQAAAGTGASVVLVIVRSRARAREPAARPRRPWRG